ncbi:bifunctional hydroxymethylpyrimidine kinase/phosphomethylpyrimidine kinase, partial [Streptomyces hygroscopicus]|uniref:bifunctional hydroxymethylpyrimidine kinase/phosphomethylpyrimidine kinase n=1 Tax=Streptomyces hygroscopicus TaxID=1912 RepID=UPI003407B04B
MGRPASAGSGRSVGPGGPGGAGIQGDLKAFASVGAYGATVLVGVTAQSPA